MTKPADAKYRREWVKSYVAKYAPVTVSEVARAAHEAAIPALNPNDTAKVYWVIAKDTQQMRRTGEIEPNSVVFQKLR